MSGFSLEAATNEPSFLVRRCHQKLAAATMLLDGEAVVLDQMGRSDFGGVQKHWGAGEEGGPQVRRPSMPSSSCTWTGKISLASRRLQEATYPKIFLSIPTARAVFPKTSWVTVPTGWKHGLGVEQGVWRQSSAIGFSVRHGSRLSIEMPVEIIEQIPSATSTSDINRDRHSASALGTFYIDTTTVAVGGYCEQNAVDVLIFQRN